MARECLVEESIVLRVSPDRVFEALTRGDQLARWWPREARTEVRQGGLLTMTWFDGGTMDTRFETVVPGQRVAYPFYGERLEFVLAPHAGGTSLTVKHHCSHADAVHIAGSWGFLKANLKAYLERGMDFRESGRA